MKTQSIPAIKEAATNAIPDALRNFDQLPDSAHVRQPVVEGLLGCSGATVWRRVKTGSLPAPKKFSARVSAWNVGELRRVLSSTGGDHFAYAATENA